MTLKKVNEPGTGDKSLRSKAETGLVTCLLLIAYFGIVVAGYIVVEGLQSIDKDSSNLYNRSVWGDILIWTALYIFIFVTILRLNSKKSELIVKAYNRAISRVASDLVSHRSNEHLTGEERDKLLDDFFNRHLLDETQVYSNLRELDDTNFIRKNLESTTKPKHFDKISSSDI
jgi:hypothetical protein